MSQTQKLSFAPALANVLTTQRVYSIDALRGITILVMIFVNEVAGVTGIPGWLKHADADADTMTFVDVVFPAFLFIVGMSIPFAIVNRISKGDSILKILMHILIRTAGLLVLGIFMVNAETGFDRNAMIVSPGVWSLLFYVSAILVWNIYTFKNTTITMGLRILGLAGLVVLAFLYYGPDGSHGLRPHWWGILGLIGWAYLVSCIIYLVTKGSLSFLLLAVVICIVFFILGSSSFAEHESWLSFFHTQKGHATHTSIVLSGVIVSLLIFDGRKFRSLRSRFGYVAVFAALCLIVAVLLRPYYGISKIHATPSWGFFSVASCAGVFALLFWLVDIRKNVGWTSFIRPAGSNPLLTYILPYIVISLMWIFDWQWPALLRIGVTGVIWSAVFALAMMVLAIVLNKWKIKLQL